MRRRSRRRSRHLTFPWRRIEVRRFLETVIILGGLNIRLHIWCVGLTFSDILYAAQRGNDRILVG